VGSPNPDKDTQWACPFALVFGIIEKRCNAIAARYCAVRAVRSLNVAWGMLFYPVVQLH
jgi:hypothetical protein